MDEDRKKTLKLGLFILLMFAFASLFFVWGMINKGKLVFSGDVPFMVMVYGEGEKLCEESPCEMTLRAGRKNFLAMKEGFRNISAEQTVRMWRKTEVDLEFLILPTLTETDVLPALPPTSTYAIVTEDGTGRQKLINAEDANRTPIVYFQKPLKDTQIFGSWRFLLIDGEDIYKIDTENRKREEIEGVELPQIEKVSWSDDGRHMVFSAKDENSLWILDTQKEEVERLSITTDIELTDWFYGNTLVFLTNQTYAATTGADKEGYRYVEFRGDISAEGYTLGFYYPESGLYSRVETFTEIKLPPEKMIALANGSSIYFKSELQDFRIILRKF